MEDRRKKLYDDLYFSQKRRDSAKLKMMEFDSMGHKDIAKIWKYRYWKESERCRQLWKDILDIVRETC